MKQKMFLTAAALVLLFVQSAFSQLISEGDTLWYKGGFPQIRQVQFTPDGTKLGVLGAVDIGVFTMFDALNGNELWTFKKSTTYFYQFTYSLDGSKVFILPPDEKQINIIDVNTGIILDSLPFVSNITTYGYGQVYQTKNPNILLLANGTECFALYDIDERKIIKERVGNLINKIFACPFSDYFISAYQYESSNKWKTNIEMYDLNTLEYVAKLGEEDGLVQSAGEAKISYNGKFAATNFGGRALQIWDLENKKLFKEYTPTIPTDSTSGRGGQTALAFCHNNENLINSGGKHISYTSPSSTSINNYINNKRALIFKEKNFTTIDVSQDDLYFVGGQYTTFYVLKLHLDAVSVNEIISSTNGIIYPNPTTGYVNINLECINSSKYEIYNTSGRLINSNEITNTANNLLTIDFSQYPAGMYSVKVYCGKAIEQYQVVRGE